MSAQRQTINNARKSSAPYKTSDLTQHAQQEQQQATVQRRGRGRPASFKKQLLNNRQAVPVTSQGTSASSPSGAAIIADQLEDIAQTFGPSQPSQRSSAPKNLSQSATAPPHGESTDQEMMQPDDEPTTFEQNLTPADPIDTPQIFEGAAKSDAIKGRSTQDKIKTTRTLFAESLEFHGAVQRILNKEKYIVIQFTDKAHLDLALQKDITFKEGDEPFRFVDLTTIKPPTSAEDKQDLDHRTIQVIDIPLNTPTPTIRSAFDRHGTIVKLTTRTRGLFQQAFITYDSATAIDKFRSDQWSDFIVRDAVRVLPVTLPQEERIRRQQHCLKLSGLPSNTAAHDILTFVKNIFGKTCFIPRNVSNYKSRNYAFINFENDEALINAQVSNFSYKGQELFWCPPDLRTCNICGSPDHFVKSCPRKPVKNPQDDKLQKLYRRMRPAQHRKPPRSYADAAKRSDNSRGSNNNRRNRGGNNGNNNNASLKNGTAAGGSQHDPSSLNLAQIMQTMKAIQQQFAVIEKDMLEINRKFDAQSQQQHSSSSTSSSTPVPSRSTKAKNKSASKRTHSDVDSSSAEEPISSSTDIVTQDQLNSVNANVSTVSNMIKGLLNSFSALQSSGVLGGDALEDDAEEMDLQNDEAEASV
jgi:RNA recognition motif. (a.k.a. RRM, RBD, or RNP domain)